MYCLILFLNAKHFYITFTIHINNESFTSNDGAPTPSQSCFPGAPSQVPIELKGPVQPPARSPCLRFVLHAPRTPSTLPQACGPLGLRPHCDPCIKFTSNVRIQ